MSDAFYSHARLYDLMFPGGGPAVDFYQSEVDRCGGSVLELGCGTGHKLIPMASDGHPCVGLDLSSGMLAEAQRNATARGVAVEWVRGDMRDFDMGCTFDFVFITAKLVAASARVRGSGQLLPLGSTTSRARGPIRLRCVQPERAPTRRGRWRTAYPGVVVVHGP
jgi:SAM-dependent methyltransferase